MVRLVRGVVETSLGCWVGEKIRVSLGCALEDGQALSLFRQLRLQMLECSTGVLNAVLSTCARKGRWQCVLQALPELDSGPPADSITYEAIFSACETGDQRWLSSTLFPDVTRLALSRLREAMGIGAPD